LLLSYFITLIDIPQGSTQYSIGICAQCRDIAQDLFPGRFEPGKVKTAIKDCFVKHAQGG
jgi:hypothetical protein